MLRLRRWGIFRNLGIRLRKITQAPRLKWPIDKQTGERGKRSPISQLKFEEHKNNDSIQSQTAEHLAFDITGRRARLDRAGSGPRPTSGIRAMPDGKNGNGRQSTAGYEDHESFVLQSQEERARR